MFSTQSLVSQMASSSLKLCFLCRGLLTFLQPTSQLLALDVCLSDAFA
ncbi:TPA: DUF645 family protein [Vibrio cholerae]|nr:DUF645 family protein [Vibrio cholerae]